jgi:hypothetical protein
MPKITCPGCGTTIDLENRKLLDFGKIFKALQGGPKTFTELLRITGLPRKTLSLRLKSLCDSGAVLKNGTYILNKNSNDNGVKDALRAVGKFSEWRKVAQIFCLIMLVTLGTGSVVSAMIQITNNPIRESVPPLKASFSISPSPPYYMGSTNTLTFDASSSIDRDYTTLSFFWQFGDGTTAAGVIVTHTYEKAGSYTVTLTVTNDNHGLSSKIQDTITILPTPCFRLYLEGPTEVKAGDIITVGIKIEEVTDLAAWQFGMTYDPKILKLISSVEMVYDQDGNKMPKESAFVKGPLLEEGGATYFVAPQEILICEGSIKIHGCMLFGENISPVSGSGTLAYVKFQAMEKGWSALNLTDILLLNLDGAIIPILSIEGTYIQVLP